MKLAKKLIFMVVLILQAHALLQADAWEDAFLIFGGGTDPVLAAQNLISKAGTFVPAGAAQTAKSHGATPEMMAVAAFLSSNARQYQQAKTGFFKKNTYSDTNVINALQAIIGNAQMRAVVTPQPTTPQPTKSSTPASSGWGWFGGTSGSTTAAQSVTSADVANAVKNQQQADLAVAAASNDTLAAIVNSGKTGASLYTAFIDYIFSVLQQAVNTIADTQTQQQIVSYIQSKVTSMKASVAANSYKSRTLGRMNSKAITKKKKNKNF